MFIPGSICIYLIEAAAVAMWKIGLSLDPLARLATLQTGSPVPLLLHSFVRVPAGKAVEVEQAIHERLRFRRKWGEARDQGGWRRS
jgi:Meiotically Up-regulated Gene 113 (MUG113) protein